MSYPLAMLMATIMQNNTSMELQIARRANIPR